MDSKDIKDYPDELYDSYHKLRVDLMTFLYEYEPRPTPNQAINCMSKVLGELIVMAGKNYDISEKKIIEEARFFGILLEENVKLHLEENL